MLLWGIRINEIIVNSMTECYYLSGKPVCAILVGLLATYEDSRSGEYSFNFFAIIINFLSNYTSVSMQMKDPLVFFWENLQHRCTTSKWFVEESENADVTLRQHFKGGIFQNRFKKFRFETFDIEIVLDAYNSSVLINIKDI